MLTVCLHSSPPQGTGLEYDMYLRQVVEVLESDDEFRKKLETANISDIKVSDKTSGSVIESQGQ